MTEDKNVGLISPRSDSSLGKTSSRQGGKAEFPLPITLKRGLLTLMSKLTQMPKGGEAPAWEVPADSLSFRGRAAPLGPGMSP